MTAVVDHRTQAEFDRKELATDLSETLLKANIPLEKLDHPAIRDFIERRVPGAGSIPSARNVRQWYLPKINTEELNLIMEEADGVIVTVDETSDNVTERSVLNLIFTPVNVNTVEQSTVSYIADQVYLDSLDHKVVAREVIKVVDSYKIPHHKIIGYVCDNVAYMSKVFTLFLAFYENCVHVSCTAHLFHLLFERVSVYGKDVHSFMVKWSGYFKNSVQRKKRFSMFMELKGLSTQKCPKPCTTRWTPWMKAVVWHAERHQHLEEFLSTEKEYSDTAVIGELSDLFTADLESDFEYLGSVVPTLIEAIESVESNSLAAHHLIQKLADLKAFLKTQSRTRLVA